MSGRFSNNFVEMFLGWPSIRFLQAKLIRRKLWPPGGGAYIAKVKKKKIRWAIQGPSWPSCFKLCDLCCNFPKNGTVDHLFPPHTMGTVPQHFQCFDFSWSLTNIDTASVVERPPRCGRSRVRSPVGSYKVLLKKGRNGMSQPYCWVISTTDSLVSG